MGEFLIFQRHLLLPKTIYFTLKEVDLYEKWDVWGSRISTKSFASL